ncbi:DUF445 domain-containing protein [Vallicoccus soli]|uniref:DUF445 domain-containing protein n=1 Tax=Vallicoccus soli TaxID=2339232 RepID=A0A3A3YXD8_9ACTN|nr:DUF445 domain-containing protein [Vallicoccus soli]RJK96339.1 DUF445 domain-containing protein [Vallicoccus soli]
MRAPVDPTELSAADLARRTSLRRHKAFATGLLLVAAVLWLVLRAQEEGGPAWVGYARAAAEAGMVGGLADWFAVTALFRHPLGVPVPHTAIIPRRKDALGTSLGEFVGANFLAEDVVRGKLRRAEVTRRLGRWLRRPEGAARVTEELARVVRAGAGLLRDEQVVGVLERAALRRLGTTSVAPALGRLLDRVVDDGAHHGLVDLAAERTHDWLVANRESLLDLMTAQAPAWSPRWLDERVSERLYAELVRIAAGVRDDPAHDARGAIDRFLAQLARDLQQDAATVARVDGQVRALAEHPAVHRSFAQVVESGRTTLLELVDDPDSELRRRITDELAALGARLEDDAPLRAKVDARVEDLVGYVVSTYRDEILTLITDTVAAWDARSTARKVELQVGRDLQYIRVNGTVVGALAGLVIHGVADLLG